MGETATYGREGCRFKSTNPTLGAQLFFQDSRKGKVRNTVVTKAGVQMRACMGVCDKAPTRSDAAFNSRASLQAPLLHIKNPTRVLFIMDWQNSLPLTVARPARLNFCPDDHSVLSFLHAACWPAGYVAFHKTLAETATAAR